MKQHILIRSLFEKYQIDVLQFIRSKFGDRHDAEDIVQDTFHNVLQRKNFDQLENPQAYIYKTAANLALNRLRNQAQHKKYMTSMQMDGDDDNHTLEHSFFAKLDLEQMNHALSKLSQKYRTTFIMSRVQHKTYRQISQELDISISTVEKHIIKVLQHLREAVK